MIMLVLTVIGLCFGSFVNAFIWRLHELESKKKLSKVQKKKLSILHGRSMCAHCGHELAWNDLLPVVSWLSLRGKCRYCGKKIDDNPLVEVTMPILFVLTYAFWPYGFDAAGWVLFGLWLVFLVGFVALAVYDLKWMLLPNKIVYFLIGLVVFQVAFKMLAYDASVVLMEAIWGFVAIGGFFYALFQVSKGKWIGGGDVKLGFLIGPLVGGPLNAIFVLFVASTVGSLFSLPLMAQKKLKPTSRIPFGPFLLLATFIVYIFGNELAELYEQIFLNIY